MSGPRGDGPPSPDEPPSRAGGAVAPAGAGDTPTDHAREALPIAARSTRHFGRAFVVTVACWSLLLPAASLLFVNRYDSFEVNFVEGLYARKGVAAERALARARGGPRLIVVGGSGALFGIDAELLEAKLGVPTVNFATHGGLGGEYVLARARRAIRPGDRVLLCIEYELWEASRDDFEGFAWDYFTSYDKRFFRDAGWARSIRALCSIPPADYRKALDGWSRWRKGRHVNARGPYNLATLSPNGDMRVAFPPTPFPAVPGYPFKAVRGPADAPHLAAFASWARANGVTVYFTWPNHCRPDGPDGAKPVQAPVGFQAALDAFGFVVLDAPSDTAFPRAWHLDTVYHTDPCARRLRTEELVRRLAPHFGRPAAPAEPTGYYVVAGGNHRPLPGNVFADDPGIRVKYLSPILVDHADALTPESLARLCEAGRPVHYDDPAVEVAARGHGWRGEEFARATASLDEWLVRYNQHLFLITSGAATDPGGAVPGDVRSALAGHAAVVAAFGTGAFSNVRRVEAGPQVAAFESSLSSLTGSAGPDVTIRLRADAGAAKPCQATFNALDLAGGGPGLHVVVIDPSAGIGVDAARFDGANPTVTWRLSRLVKGAP